MEKSFIIGKAILLCKDIMLVRSHVHALKEAEIYLFQAKNF